MSFSLLAEFKDIRRKFDAENHDKATIVSAIRLFKSLVQQFSDPEENGESPVEAKLLDAVIRMCLVDLLPAIHQFLRLPPPTAKTDENDEGKPFNLSRCKKWPQLVGCTKVYLANLLKLMDASSNPSITTKILRHILYLIPFFLEYVNLTKYLIKRAMIIWSQGDETNRILAFLVILRLSRQQEPEMISFILKKLYLSYVKNCKLINKQTLPMISFMQHSLVELYSLDHGVAYQHAFVFIRQCAISLRNAYTSKEKDAFKPIYNWQYVQSLILWSRLLTCLQPSETLKPLIHPLVQVITGTIKHLPASRFYPLRFHLARALIKLSKSSKYYIPVLPILLEVLDEINYEKKFKSTSEKNLDFECLTRVSPQLVLEKNFVNACVEKSHELILEYCAAYSHTIAFPELVCFPLIKLKKFVKKCTVATHGKMIKKLVEKIEQTVKITENKRNFVTFSFSDTSSVNQWENELRDQGTPLSQYFAEYSKEREAKLQEEIRNEELSKQRRKKEKPNKNIHSDEEAMSEEYYEDEDMSEPEESENNDEEISEKEDEEESEEDANEPGPSTKRQRNH